MLHQMMKVKWHAWKALPAERQKELADEAVAIFGDGLKSAPYAMLGHKGDLMLVHFRRSFEELAQVQLAVSRLGISEYLETVNSYVSMVELGLYESTGKTYRELTERGVAVHSEEWDKGIEEVLQRQRGAMASRLHPDIPAAKFICFYPMDRKRGEHKNWYMEPLAERARMMAEHGMVGRRYAGTVRQIITGSIGFDDWEWGVDLFAEDPLIFKKLIYEMRFDQVSADFALFGAFFIGLRFAAKDLGAFLGGQLPAWPANA